MAATSETYQIPRWFTAFVAVCLGLAIPWGAWATLTLAKLEVRMEAVPLLQRQLQEHLEDRTIHHVATQELRGRVSGLEKRVDNLEERK